MLLRVLRNVVDGLMDWEGWMEGIGGYGNHGCGHRCNTRRREKSVIWSVVGNSRQHNNQRTNTHRHIQIEQSNSYVLKPRIYLNGEVLNQKYSIKLSHILLQSIFIKPRRIVSQLNGKPQHET